MFSECFRNSGRLQPCKISQMFFISHSRSQTFMRNEHNMGTKCQLSGSNNSVMALPSGSFMRECLQLCSNSPVPRPQSHRLEPTLLENCVLAFGRFSTGDCLKFLGIGAMQTLIDGIAANPSSLRSEREGAEMAGLGFWNGRGNVDPLGRFKRQRYRIVMGEDPLPPGRLCPTGLWPVLPTLDPFHRTCQKRLNSREGHRKRMVLIDDNQPKWRHAL
jgi:hypothetical protein